MASAPRVQKGEDYFPERAAPNMVRIVPLGGVEEVGRNMVAVEVGATGDIGKGLGIDNRWAYNIVKQVGNYGESFEANLKPLGFERGINALWTHGGIMYAPPIR